jgi:hypothetical protein
MIHPSGSALAPDRTLPDPLARCAGRGRSHQPARIAMISA